VRPGELPGKTELLKEDRKRIVDIQGIADSKKRKKAAFARAEEEGGEIPLGARRKEKGDRAGQWIISKKKRGSLPQFSFL